MAECEDIGEIIDIHHGRDTVKTDDKDKEYNDQIYQMASVAAMSCLQNGFSEESVTEAEQTFIAKNGHDQFKGADLCQILFDKEIYGFSNAASFTNFKINDSDDSDKSNKVNEDKNKAGDDSLMTLTSA